MNAEATVKEILCLANSRKLNGRCVAGIEIQDDKRTGWIRPVSQREHEEVSEADRRYVNGQDPRVLDIIKIPLLEHRPRLYHQENWLLDPGYYWEKTRRLAWNDLNSFLDPTAALWINGNHTYNGLNDQIPFDTAKNLRTSLRFIHTDNLKLRTFAPRQSFGDSKRRVHAIFRHAGVDYKLWVTDPVCEQWCLAQEDGTHTIGESYLTVSISEEFNGYCYKLVAAVIENRGIIK